MFCIGMNHHMLHETTGMFASYYLFLHGHQITGIKYIYVNVDLAIKRW
jgi:hypothetical protein